ncbi:MAG: ARMT1-like domain-containing protein [Phycisphaerae bacterium]|jgi:uncharacterized protein with ATP-grasp and redox domains
MQTCLECVPCFVRQALDASHLVSNDPSIHERVLRQTLALAAQLDFQQSPPWVGQQIHHFLRQATVCDDPYLPAKQQANQFALALRPMLAERLAEATDPFALATRLAIAGNIIDLGCKTRVRDEEIRRAVEDALRTPLDPQALARFRAAVDAATKILYLADNAGEIVLDALLIAKLPVERVTVAVRGRPVINDATRDDAAAAGLTELVPIIDNGSDVPGTILASCSSEFRQQFALADLIIAKGQGNYETLNDVDQNIWFLLQAKCPVIARDIGCPVGQAVLCTGSRNHTAGTHSALSPQGANE